MEKRMFTHLARCRAHAVQVLLHTDGQGARKRMFASAR
jgi:hypothetical protein